MRGSSASSRSLSAKSVRSLEDGSGAIHDRARMAGRVHGQPAARAERAPRGQHGLSLLGEGDDLLVAEPEADAGRIVAGGGSWLLAGFRRGRTLAGHEYEHAPGFVVAEAHLADLPLRLAGDVLARLGRRLGLVDALSLHHLVQADDEGLDLRFLAGESEGVARAAGEEEEPALARLADGRDGDAVDW